MNKMNKAYEKFYEGQDLFYGDNKQKNYRKAFHCLSIAADFGIPHAQNLIGQCYSYGLGVIRDEGKAFRWYRKAALNRSNLGTTKQNYAISLCNLAMMYDQGKGTFKNLKLAFKYYRQAAELGDSNAQCNLAVLYREGHGVKRDDTKAVYWCRKAAKNGDDKAQYNLGLTYLDGDGVQQDQRLARYWFEKAARQGDKRAMHKLKKLYRMQPTSLPSG